MQTLYFVCSHTMTTTAVMCKSLEWVLGQLSSWPRPDIPSLAHPDAAPAVGSW